MHRRSHRATAVVAGVVLATIAVTPGVVAQSASPLAAGKRVVVLMPTTTNTYIAEWAKGAEEEAARQGIKLERIENNFDQNEQNTQAQQQINAGTPPDAFVWWPADNNAGVATLTALAATGVPVFQTNQLPAASAPADSWVAYAGVNDTLNGQVAGEMLLKARDALVEAGTLKLHSDGGNAIAVKFIAGYQAADDRMAGFHSAVDAAGVTLLAEEPAGFDAQTGYTAAQGLITANKDKGIDLVYAHNDALADGVIQALEEAGYTPGKDVAVVGGTCHGKLDNLENGKQWATGLQAARLEGVSTLDVIARYLANPTVQDGEYNALADPDAAPAQPSTISRYNYIPNPGVPATEIDSTKLWGFTLRDLCTY